MKVIFKTETYGFHSEWNDSAAAQEIIKRAPVRGKVHRRDEEIYLGIEIDALCEKLTTDIKSGDIMYRPKKHELCILIGSASDRDVSLGPVVVVGHTHASSDELSHIREGEAISIELQKEKTQKPDAQRFTGGILSQPEIDSLVAELISQQKDGKT